VNVIDSQERVVFRGKSDAECVRWWQREGQPGDRLDTGELMSDVEEILRLEP
jgi:hypothetical protein